MLERVQARVIIAESPGAHIYILSCDLLHMLALYTHNNSLWAPFNTCDATLLIIQLFFLFSRGIRKLFFVLLLNFFFFFDVKKISYAMHWKHVELWIFYKMCSTVYILRNFIYYASLIHFTRNLFADVRLLLLNPITLRITVFQRNWYRKKKAFSPIRPWVS